MRKRTRISLVALAACALVICGWALLRPRAVDPIVDGRPLTSWLEGPPEAADRALDKVGTNAIPTLLWMLRQVDSPFKRHLAPVRKYLFVIHMSWTPAKTHNRSADLAFHRLGARAEPAVPALLEIYKEKRSLSSQQETARSLGGIGPPAKAAIPVLISDLATTNDLLRIEIVRALGDFHAEPDLVVAALTNALNDPNPEVRIFACEALGNVGQEATPAVPAMLKLLLRPQPDLEWEAARAVWKIEPPAIVPALTNWINGANPATRRAALGALLQITGHALREEHPMAKVLQETVPALERAMKDPDAYMSSIILEEFNKAGRNLKSDSARTN